MGTLTTDEMLEEVVEGVGNRTDMKVTDARPLRALNLAQEELASVRDWAELQKEANFSMIASNPKKTFAQIATDASLLSFDPKEIYTLRIVDSSDRSKSRKLIQMKSREYDTYIADPQFVGEDEPTLFVQWATTLEWFSTPDQAYPCTIRYYDRPSVLSAGAGKSDFSQKDRVLIHLALHYLMHSLGEEDRAKEHWNIVYGRKGLIDKLEDDEAADTDVDVVAHPDPHNRKGGLYMGGQYWRNPLVRRSP